MAQTSITKLTATIGAGQPLSNVVDAGTNFVVGIIMPPAWTTAPVSILVSLDSTNFHDLFVFHSGDSTTLSEFKFNVTPGAIVTIDPDTMVMVRYIRLRSGSRDHPVLQESDRVFSIIVASQVASAR